MLNNYKWKNQDKGVLISVELMLSKLLVFKLPYT